MDRWRVRQGVPYRLQHGGGTLLVGINDIVAEPRQVALSVFAGGQATASYLLRVGDHCEIAGQRWCVTGIEPGARGFADLEAGD